jgi:hypothetical protein
MNVPCTLSFKRHTAASRRFMVWTAGAACVLVSAGCGGDRLATAPAEGKVLYQGKPLEFGYVEFQPEAGPNATAMIEADGTFRLSTYGEGDGAVIGEHRVRISCVETQRPGAPPASEGSPTGWLIPEKYGRPAESGLTATVREENDPFVFELSDE